MTAAASPVAADRPAHYRLSTETWELILKEYREGATAPFLARKWRVSEHALRQRITRHGATKRDWGDAQAIGQAVAREAELEEARRNAPEAVAARLFAGVDLDDHEGDPAELARAATLASGRAMKGRLWNEAKALAALAETYARLGEREARAAGGMTIEALPLPLLHDILFDKSDEVHARFALWGDGPETEHYELRKAYWDRRQRNAKDADRAMYRNADRLRDLERMIRDLGGVPPPWPDASAVQAVP